MKNIVKVSLLSLCFYFSGNLLYSQDISKKVIPVQNSEQVVPLKTEKSIPQPAKLQSVDYSLVRIYNKVHKRLKAAAAPEIVLQPIDYKDVEFTPTTPN